MEGNDWEDVGHGGDIRATTYGNAAPSGRMSTNTPVCASSPGAEVPGVEDALTNAMMKHFVREISKGSTSVLPQVVSVARRYFNVSHGYVLRKCLWQLVPVSSQKTKSTDGELGAESDWTVRMVDGLQVDFEEPDLYIPTMGFVTYVLLGCLIKGLQETFHPDVFSALMTFALVTLVVETAVFKGILFTAGAVNTPTVDLAALLAYKFYYISLHMMCGLILGGGHHPGGFLFRVAALLLVTACGFALWQAFRRLARMQPSVGQECVTDAHKLVVKALPALQIVAYYLLLPTWPAPVAVVAKSMGLPETPGIQPKGEN